MSSRDLLPRAQAPIAGNLAAAPEYWKFFRELANESGASTEQVEELLQKFGDLDIGSLDQLAKAEGVGIAVKIPGSWVFRTINGSPDRIVVTTGNAVATNPQIDLATLVDTGIGAAIWKFTRDQWGRVEGTEAATTDDLAEGATNLYFTDERAQDAVGSILQGVGGDVELHYAPGTPLIFATLSPGVLSDLALAETAIQPGDNVSELANDAGYVNAADLAAYAQPLDATLTALSGTDWASNSIPVGTGPDTVSQTSFPANTFPARGSAGALSAKAISDFGLTLVDDSNAAAAKTTLGIPTLDHGTYTPTLTNGANVSSSIASQCQYLRVGNTVTVSGRIDIAPTAGGGTQTVVGISLPIASNFSSSANLAGSGGFGQNPYATALILADTTNDRASFNFHSNVAASTAALFTFTYLVI